MLERLLALTILLFALVWGASVLGTPDAPAPEPPAAPPEGERAPAPAPEPEREPAPAPPPPQPKPRGLLGGLLGPSS